ncbi:hypothetical protein KEJ34_06485 [Candidatus Bathyarchaeota archaeon]|nr:hypothetical protein [Candidatus Bathyarchaeota archaeon]
MLTRRFWMIATILSILIFLTMASATLPSLNSNINEHVYYGYVPPTTNIAGGEGDYPGEVDELIEGTVISYTVPSGVAILDVVGLEDDTYIEIWDIYSNVMLASEVIDKFEKKFFYISAGSFFKLVSSQRVAAMLAGGAWVFEPEGSVGGTSTFYPSVTGGFRGREFVFVAAPGTHPYAYSKDRIGYNFYLFALRETDWSLSDVIERWTAGGHLKQRDSHTTILQSRKHRFEYNNGAGNNVVYRLTTTSDAVLSCSALGDFVAVPAITGGYVGRVFYAPVSVTLEEEGRSAAFIVIPLEEGKVTVYNEALDTIAERTFTSSDVENRNYWYHNLGIGRFKLIVQSAGNICFMVGQTEGVVDMDHLGDDITFVGAKPNQEVRFYAPTMAVVFAPEDLMISIDGGAPIRMEKDEFRLLESGCHSVKADKHVIVEVLAGGSSWDDWGSYLMEPLDVDASFEVPEGFLEKRQEYTTYIIIAAVVIVVIAAALMLRRRGRRAARV